MARFMAMRSQTMLVAAVGAAVGVLMLGTASGSAAPTSPTARTYPAVTAEPPVPTGLIASPLATPHPVLGADGRRHLVYELQLINATSSAVTVTTVRTVDATTGAILATLDADAIKAVMHKFGAAPGSTLGPGGAGFILMDAALPTTTTLPRRLVHDFSLGYQPDLGLPVRQRSGFTPIARDHATEIGAPLAGRRWIAFNGCCGPTSHREAVNPLNGAFHVSERFAIDFAQLDAAGRGVHGDPEQLSSFPSYGAKVFSVASGVVVGALDGIADNVPVGSLPPNDLETVGGNYVVVDIGGGRFGYYAHLRPGSLRVHVGERVRRGQVLGLVGNSGNSDFPHLHFHLMDGPSPLVSDGLPYEFRSFTSEGTLANVDELFAGGVARFDPQLSGPHTRRLPLDLQSVDFTSPHDGG